MFLHARKLIKKLAELCDCPACGSKSYYMDTNGKQHCMDCGNEW
ncbi:MULTISPECIES: hypothetical protein [unclassified Streptomyces]|nr:hypothetical protein [Streptomyces sp. CB01201]